MNYLLDSNASISTTKSSYKSLLLVDVIAGELEGSWRAEGQQEGLQYSGGSA
jgi:hypothetical protein